MGLLKFRHVQTMKGAKSNTFMANCVTVHLIQTGFSPGGRGKRRGLEPRNDVLTTCKVVSLRGGQRIIAVFFPQ